MIFVASIILLLYIQKILDYSSGWNKLYSLEDSQDVKLTIIVAFRNEADKLPELLKNLQAQNYPLSLVQFIFVDDFSEDNSFDVVNSFSFKKTLLQSPRPGKKAAIEYALKNANNDIILTTDADCSLGPNWIRKLINPFIEENAQLVFGPVVFSDHTTLFYKFQAIEFMSLIASGAGAAGNNRPFMCNAANMAFRKSIFVSNQGYIASGDDVFLLHHVKRNKGRIFFVKEREAIVRTNPKPTLSDFINQRKRWASKSSSYKDRSALWSAFLVFSTNFFLIYFIIMLQFKIFILMYLFKSIIDYLFLRKVSVFFHFQKLMHLFWILQIIYPFYIVWVSVASQFYSYNWKNRVYKK